MLLAGPCWTEGFTALTRDCPGLKVTLDPGLRLPGWCRGALPRPGKEGQSPRNELLLALGPNARVARERSRAEAAVARVGQVEKGTGQGRVRLVTAS